MLSTRDSTRMNVWKSQRSYNLNSALDLRMVPTLLKENVRLFTTNDPDEVGMLYMKEDAFYNRKNNPEYALSVSPGLYAQLMNEANDSFSTPLGLYFCCHGGDGAHSGVAHDDYVHIGVAWIIVMVLMITIVVLSADFISIGGEFDWASERVSDWVSDWVHLEWADKGNTGIMWVCGVSGMEIEYERVLQRAIIILLSKRTVNIGKLVVI